MSFSVLFTKSKVRYDREILKLRVAQIERRIWLVTLDVANILVTASRIGSQLAIKSGDAKPRRVTQWRLATKLHTEEISLLKTHVLHVETQAFFSTTLCWLWGKSPDQRQRVPVVKTRVFLESFGEEASCRAGRGKDGLSKQSYASWHRGWCSTQRGLLSLCPPLFFKSSKVNSQCQSSFELTYVCFAECSMLATWFKDGGEEEKVTPLRTTLDSRPSQKLTLLSFFN